MDGSIIHIPCEAGTPCSIALASADDILIGCADGALQTYNTTLSARTHARTHARSHALTCKLTHPLARNNEHAHANKYPKL